MVEEALLPAVFGLFGSIVGVVLSGLFGLMSVEQTQEATDERVRGKIYEVRRADTLQALGENATSVKAMLDTYSNAVCQAPEMYDRGDLEDTVAPAVREYVQTVGTIRMYSENEALMTAIDEFTTYVTGTQVYLAQAAKQGTTEPSNAPPLDETRLNETYHAVMDELRDEMANPTDDFIRE